ncbi:hypothetical protein [Brucella inopinata]|uniref:Uncharacterized protein n=1 Tax=Brucella inopinata TaxID=1218315 RepID=A0AAW7B5M3_9HYPH|nr:hypothetical protein [Brucella inopinata]EFM55075.1 hypothetical protein BIBO1_3112 [Brucella inopinata BO1]KEY05224.1 hypothetical protein IL59_0205360 [Brucella suis bv. 4 str. 40]MDL2331866.1 hypothetical protein [Brucella inopinata]
MAYTTWNDISDLSIKVYNLNTGATTATLEDTTTIYANKKHQAVVVISFVPLDTDNNPIQDTGNNLPPPTLVRNAVELLNWDTGNPITTEAGEDWSYTTTASAFAWPLDMAITGSFALPTTSLDNNSKYTLVYYVQASATSDSMNIGMQLDVSKLNPAMGNKIIQSKLGGSHDETCTITTINASEIPFNILSYNPIYTSPDSGDDVPLTQNPPLTPENFFRAIHIAYYLNWNAAKADFRHNNSIFNAGVTMGGSAYNPDNTKTPTQQQEDPTSGTMNITENCCFLDQRDGLYSYKGYLWPKCLVNIDDIKEQKGNNDRSTAITNNSKDATSFKDTNTYNLYQDAMPTQPIDLSKIYADEAGGFDFDKSVCIYMTIYLTFGYELQYFKRQRFYSLEINDQYGNSLNLFVNPANCPKIFNAFDEYNYGISMFLDNTIEWLSEGITTTENNTIGIAKDVFGWLIPHPSTNADNRVLKFDFVEKEMPDDGNEVTNIQITDVKFQASGDYDKLQSEPNTGYAIRTIRTENQNASNFNYAARTYKLGMLPPLGEDPNSVITIVSENHEYKFGVSSSINPNEPNTPYNWQFYPVWNAGGFIMYGVSQTLKMYNATLMVADPEISSDLYQIGNSSDFSDAVFATVQALNFDSNTNQQEPDKPVQGPIDGGTGTINNPYEDNPNFPSRGDWVSVENVQLSWATDPTKVGTTIYPNGLHQTSLFVEFDALRYVPGSTTPTTDYCEYPPTQDYVNRSISIIDYDTGNSIELGADGWAFGFTKNSFFKIAPNASWGNTNNDSPAANSGKPYHYGLSIYITNNSGEALNPRKIGVCFTIDDPKWSSPIVITLNGGAEGAPVTPMFIKTFAEPILDTSDIQILTYYSNTVGTYPDDKVQKPQGEPCDLGNYNRSWSILFLPQKATITDKILGWRLAKEDHSSTYQTTAMPVGRKSIGLYHNEFWLLPIGSFQQWDLSSTSLVTTSNYTVTPIAGGQQSFKATIRPTAPNLYVEFHIYASFSGQCCVGYDFPPVNIEWVDTYGNTYPFSIELSSLPMLFTNKESGSLPSNPSTYVTQGKNTQTISKALNYNVSYSFSTIAYDHSLIIGPADTQTSYKLYYGLPSARDRITLRFYGGNRAQGLVTNIPSGSVNNVSFVLEYAALTQERNTGMNWGPGEADNQFVADNYTGHTGWVGNIMSDRFSFSLQPIWTNGHLALLNLEFNNWLNVLDGSSDYPTFYTAYDTSASNYTIAVYQE